MKKLLESWPALVIVGSLLLLGATGATLWGTKANADEFAKLKSKVDTDDVKLEQALKLLDEIHTLIIWKNEKR